MNRLICLCFVLSLAACREWPEPSFNPDAVGALPNVTLGDLRTYLHSEARMTFAEPIEIAGRVVSSDRAGNFYNTFFIDDGTGAAEIMAGMPDLDALYRPGQQIAVRARGLAVGWRDGVMQLGLPPEAGNRFATGYFYHRAVIRNYVNAERSVEPVAPIETNIANLSLELCGRPVRIAGLVAEAETGDTTWAASTPVPVTGYVRFRAANAAGPATDSDYITVITSGYASWAASPVPRGTVTLTGILFYGRSGGSRDRFFLKLRDESDIEI